jgi:hypothetical protein
MKNLKRIFCLLVVVISVLSTHAKQLKVLFIGNSYTYTNDLPLLVSQLAASSGDTLVYSSSAPGGYRFQDHCTNTSTISLIAQGKWDYVVLQEQSQLPSFREQEVEQQVYPYAAKLDSIIKSYNACTKTVFYMTWGRKNGDASNCAYYAPTCTYVGMDTMLELRYTNMADSSNALISPVSLVWRELRKTNPSIELYNPDESHPSISGSYAAACAFYAVFYKKDPSLCSFSSWVNATNAAIIRNAAKKIVFDSLDTWYRFSPAIHAGFNFTTSGMETTFGNASIGATSFTWYFGDGDSSSQQHPVHRYKANGYYQAKLIVRRCADTDTSIQTVKIEAIGVGISESGNLVVGMYPNPVNGVLNIQSAQAIDDVLIADISGRIMLKMHTAGAGHIAIDVNQLVPGYYSIHLISKIGTYKGTFIRQ